VGSHLDSRLSISRNMTSCSDFQRESLVSSVQKTAVAIRMLTGDDPLMRSFATEIETQQEPDHGQSNISYSGTGTFPTTESPRSTEVQVLN
jgi:hypothetical protein